MSGALAHALELDQWPIGALESELLVELPTLWQSEAHCQLHRSSAGRFRKLYPLNRCSFDNHASWLLGGVPILKAHYHFFDLKLTQLELELDPQAVEHCYCCAQSLQWPTLFISQLIAAGFNVTESDNVHRLQRDHLAIAVGLPDIARVRVSDRERINDIHYFRGQH